MYFMSNFGHKWKDIEFKSLVIVKFESNYQMMFFKIKKVKSVERKWKWSMKMTFFEVKPNQLKNFLSIVSFVLY